MPRWELDSRGRLEQAAMELYGERIAVNPELQERELIKSARVTT
jgi:hypothetical protein